MQIRSDRMRSATGSHGGDGDRQLKQISDAVSEASRDLMVERYLLEGARFSSDRQNPASRKGCRARGFLLLRKRSTSAR